MASPADRFTLVRLRKWKDLAEPSYSLQFCTRSNFMGDRFITNRCALDVDVAGYIVRKKFVSSPSYHIRRLASNIFRRQNIIAKNARVLAYKSKPIMVEKSPSVQFLNNLFINPKKRKTSRYVPQKSERTLDCPGFVDDYYLNLLDWSSTNIIAIALSNIVYLWDANNSSSRELMRVEDEEGPVTSLAWAFDGNHIAVGLNNGDIQIWDASSVKQVRTMSGHSGRVGSLAWNGHTLSSGSQDYKIFNHDVQRREHVVCRLTAHEEEVCGLKWCESGRLLASGGNDNLLHIWDVSKAKADNYLFRMEDHTAAVKALAWCPYEGNLLASGGGTADRNIKFWNTQTGACTKSVDTKSQVCALEWNRHEQELLSSHGLLHNQLTLWEYPSMIPISELFGHTARVLHLAQSPDGYSVASASGDESLQIWQVFGSPERAKRSKKKKEETKTRPWTTPPQYNYSLKSAHKLIR